MTELQRHVECIHARVCGACGLLGLAVQAQLDRKREVVASAFRGQKALRDVVVGACLPSPRIEGYRNRAKMAVAYRINEGALLGYFGTGTRQVMDATDCRVLEPALLETTRSLRKWMRSWTERELPLRFIDVRCGSNPEQQMLTLVLDSKEALPLPLAAIRRACPSVTGIAVNLNPGRGAQVIRGRMVHAWGDETLLVETGSARLKLSASAFFQVNLHVLPALHALMREHLGKGRSLVDLYSGVGTHGLALKDNFASVLLIEGASAAVRDARSSCEASGASGVHVMGSPVERALPRLLSARPDAVVLNPSREGARRDVMETIAASTARRVAYLSCEPVTLARDLEVLLRAGFRIDATIPIDMMPQTRQVEALALLSRERAPETAGVSRSESRGPRGGGGRGATRGRPGGEPRT